MGFIVERKNKDGKSRYKAQVRLKGHPSTCATFIKLTDARKWVQETECSIRDGRYFKHTQAKKKTLCELIDRYIKTIIPTKKSFGKQQTQQLEFWKKNLGSYFLFDITPLMIAEKRDLLLQEGTTRSEKKSSATINRYLSVLSHAFYIASTEWGWIENNPVSKVKRPREPRGRVRFLEEGERRRLLEACRNSPCEYLYAVVIIAISTGMRYAEITNLKWKDIDFPRERIIIQESKNGERRSVPLVGHALDIISAIKKVRNYDIDLVFPSSKDFKKPVNFHHYWDLALEQAKIEDFRFHDLRHCCASYLAMNGATIAEIGEILGHKSMNMVKRYLHLTDSHTSKVVKKMNNEIFKF